MKAIVCPESETPGVLKLVDVDKTNKINNEILVKVIASLVTSGEFNLRKMPKIVMHLPVC